MLSEGGVQFELDGPKVDTRWPVSFGVPFAEGELSDTDTLVLQDAGGKYVPLQTDTKVRWPDGSIRWLLLDFIADMGARERTFRLLKGKPRRNGVPGISVEEKLDGIVVASGGCSAVIPYNGSGTLENVEVEKSGKILNSTYSTVVEADGAVHDHGAPYKVMMETLGEQRVTVLGEGYFESRGESVFKYEVRTQFFAHLPLVKIVYTVVNECDDNAGRFLSHIDFGLQLSAAPALSFISRPGGRVKQLSSKQYSVDGMIQDGRYPGCVAVDGVLTGMMKDFWQRYPSSIGGDGQNLKFGMLASDEDDGGMLFAQGEAQSREMWLWFGDNAPSERDMAELVQHRPLLLTSPQRMCDTRAFGDLAPVDKGKNSAFEKGVEEGFEEALRTREEREEYGFRDYGDSRYDAMPRGWLNNEYDWGHAYLLQFARSGDRRYWDFAEGRVRHMMDTDIIHYKTPPEGRLIGAPHAHSTDHTAGGVDIGHSWLEGLFDLWVLSGDERAGRHGRAMADFYVGCVGNVAGQRYKSRPGGRRPGWGLIGLMYAYEFTRDERYLEAGRQIVKTCAREQVGSGAWKYPIGGVDDPLCQIGKTFMVALTLRGLMRFHSFTGDGLALELLLNGLDWAVDYMWDEESAGFRYTDDPHGDFKTSPGSSCSHILDSLAYAARHTGDERYNYVAAHTWREWLKDVESSSEIKPSQMRHTLHYVPHHEDVSEYPGCFPMKSLSKPVKPFIRDIAFMDDRRGVAVGLYGKLLTTEDGGCSWVVSQSEHDSHLFTVDVTDGGLGLAAGVGPDLLATTDAGESWERRRCLNVSGRNRHYDLKMVDDKNGFLGGNGHIWMTGDGGRSWTDLWDVRRDGRWDKVVKVLSIHPLGCDKLWAVGSMNMAMTMSITDGEVVVERQGFKHPPICLCVEFLDELCGVIGCQDGSICRTVDGGRSWETIRAAENGIYDIEFCDKETGYAVGENGLMLVTGDGGESWKQLDTGASECLRALHVFDPDNVIVGGDGGCLIRSGDGGYSWETAHIG